MMNIEYVKGLVSVIIPTYKRSAMLGRAIKSVLAQTYREIEVLVVSDNEPGDEYTEEAAKVVSDINDSKVRLILQKKHINGAAARNAGIREAKGQYVAFLDDDDYWESRKLELQVALLETLDESYGGVTCKNKHYCNGTLVAALPPVKENDLCKNILLRLADLSTDAILLRRKCLDETGYFDETLRRHQEVQLMAFFTQKYKIKLLDMYLVCVDSSKNENQPSPQKMELVKHDFLNAVEPVLSSFTDKDQKNIKTMHRFEVGLLYFRNGEKKKGLSYCSEVLHSPKTIYYAYKYVKKKLVSHVNAEKRVEHDGYTKLLKVAKGGRQ